MASEGGVFGGASIIVIVIMLAACMVVLPLGLGQWPSAALTRAPVAAVTHRVPPPVALAHRDSRSRDRKAQEKFRKMAMLCHPDVAGGSVAAFQALVDENNEAKNRARTESDVQTVLTAVATAWLCLGAPHPDPLATLATLVGACAFFDSGGAKSSVCRFLPTQEAAAAAHETTATIPAQRPRVISAARGVGKKVASLWTSVARYRTVWDEYAASA